MLESIHENMKPTGTEEKAPVLTGAFVPPQVGEHYLSAFPSTALSCIAAKKASGSLGENSTS